MKITKFNEHHQIWIFSQNFFFDLLNIGIIFVKIRKKNSDRSFQFLAMQKRLLIKMQKRLNKEKKNYCKSSNKKKEKAWILGLTLLKHYEAFSRAKKANIIRTKKAKLPNRVKNWLPILKNNLPFQTEASPFQAR